MEKSRAQRPYPGQLDEMELETQYEYQLEVLEEKAEWTPRSDKHQTNRKAVKRNRSLRLLTVRTKRANFAD